jgi:hypothetical protein
MPYGMLPTILLDWKGQHIAFGEYSAGVVVAGSADWLHWNLLAEGSSAPLSGADTSSFSSLIAHSDSRLVAFDPGSGSSDATVRISTDAATWTKIADESIFAGDRVYGVTWGSGKFLAVGADNKGGAVMWASADGSAWQKVPLSSSTFRDGQLFGIAATSHGYVLTGRTCVPVAHPPEGGSSCSKVAAAAWLSADGTTWTKSTVDQGSMGAVYTGTVWVAPHGLVAVGLQTGGQSIWDDMEVRAAWTSADGRTWRLRASDWGTPTEAGGIFPWDPAVGDSSRLISVEATEGNPLGDVRETQDGVTWHQLPASGYQPSSGDYGLLYGLPVLSLSPHGIVALVEGQDSTGTSQVYTVFGTGLR